MTARETTGPSGSGSERRATSSIEALPQIPHDAVATKWRSATFESSNGRDRRTTIVSSGWLSAPGRRRSCRAPLAVDQSLRPQEADRQLGLVAGRPHRDRHRDRILARAGCPDLERRLADDPVVADLERVAADRHDPPAGHVADRRDRVAGQVGHVVPSRAATNEANAARAVSAASTATPSAARPASPPPDVVQSMNRSARRPVRVEHGGGRAMRLGVAVGRWVVPQPVALCIDEIEDIDRRRPDCVGVLRLSGSREGAVQTFDRGSGLVEVGEEFGPGEERRAAGAGRGGGGRVRGRHFGGGLG